MRVGEKAVWRGLLLVGLGLVACSSDPSADVDPSVDEDENPAGSGDDAGPPGQDPEPGDGDGDGDGDQATVTCGDGQVATSEQCDDANDNAGDGCSVDCKVEPGFVCPNPGAACIASVVCGDKDVGALETCDDGNTTSGDGCTEDCKLEANYLCETPGEPCRSLAVCGDARVVGSEQCDDGNVTATDGCDADCQLEPGYACATPGRPCRADRCGDRIVAGTEQCEDGNTAGNDGCQDCLVEDGFVCENGASTPPSACRATVCNDGKKEGSEPCDDGNQVVGDGCNPFCEVEPDCSGESCKSSCGDGMKLPSDNEACDDGNTRDGDGCSADCKPEPGYACRDESSTLTDELEVPVTFRDMVAIPSGGSTRHPDFEHPTWNADEVTQGMVEATLGADRKPVYTGICQDGSMPGPCPFGAQTTSEARFDEWYRDVAGVNLSVVTRLTLTRVGTGTSYQFPVPANRELYPLDDAGWVAMGREADGYDVPGAGHNFGFTSEIRHWFEFEGGERFTFSGDDDVWVFVGGKLALDMGGLHPRVNRTMVIEADGTARCYMDAALTAPCATPTRALGLTVGRIYELVLFHAERHTNASNFDLMLTGFVSAHSECDTVCGDGVATPDEACDDGAEQNTGAYGGCTASCELGPHCGDKMVQSGEGEACDDGVNLTPYGVEGCAPGCVVPPHCGDAQVDAMFGERCDDGKNDDSYGSCTPDCQLGPRCGDGKVQASEGEECDDGNQTDLDGCGTLCQRIDVL